MPAPLMDRYPAISDLERRAAKRMPRFAWEYLASGTGDDDMVRANCDAMRDIRFAPEFLKGALDPQTSTTLFGIEYAAPIGIAPVGLTSLIWPGADAALAATAATRRIPYALSTVGTEAPEVAGPNADGMGWFQLYPPRSPDLRIDIIKRAADSGFTTLVLTADIPWPSRRERQRKAHVRVPPKIGPTLVAQTITHPAWTAALLRNGMPRFKTLEGYDETKSMKGVAGFISSNLGNSLSRQYVESVRDQWTGPLVIKGILSPSDARLCLDLGADAVQVSNHGGRQLDATEAAIDALGPIVAEIGGEVPVLFDGGVRSGLDVARAIALGADFVFAGRPFMFGLGALGSVGAGHAADILIDGLVNTMYQVGVESLDELSARLRPHHTGANP